MSMIVKRNGEFVNLRDYSKHDKVWDTHKAKTDQVSKLFEKYADNPTDQKRVKRLDTCGGYLRFGMDEHNDLHLIEAHFCHQMKACPICQWRRSLMLKAKFYSNIEKVIADHPTVRFIFLTLTVKNCEIKELRKTIQWMNKSFINMTKRKFFQRDIKGFIRNVEVTRNSDNETAHPHMHIILAVSPTYFKSGHYITKDSWAQFWKESLNVDYTPVCDVRICTDQNKNKAIKELLKYPVKEADIDTTSKWFYDYVQQTRHLRFISTGGILKDVIKDGKVTDDELIHTDQEQEDHDQIKILDFEWKRKVKRYQRIK